VNDSLRRAAAPVAASLGVFAAASACHLLGTWIMSKVTGFPVSRLLMKWDGAYYLAIAKHGYPTHRPHGASVIAFYPLYPIFTRGVMRATPFGDYASSLLVAAAFSAGAVVAVWYLARTLYGPVVAYRSVALFAFAPGAFVFTMGYSEGAFVLFATLALLMLLQKHWVLAGLFSAASSVTRSIGVAVAAACLVAAFLAIRDQRHNWRPLLAPLLAGLGVLVMPVYYWWHVGDLFAYSKAHDEGWGKHFDFGADTVRHVGGLFVHPFRDVNLLFNGLAVAFILGGIVLLFYAKAPAPILAYVLVNAAAILLASNTTSTWRLSLAAMPLTIAYARVLKGNVFAVALAVSAGLFVMLGMAASTIYYTP
jgi:Dolichyl-phosphate-mannose-protein mannosyltransferase